MIINGEEHSELCTGIDLGTTNSVLATVNLMASEKIVSRVVGIDRAVDMYNAGGIKFTMKNGQTLPSCVYYNEEKNFAPVVGDFAKSRYSIRPHLVAKSIKSQMGNAVAEGLAPNVPDKTPAQISARILEHMLRNAAKIYRQEKIEDAVITVPASFDSVMCQATLEAARLAGIKIYNADGSIRQILLPEPQAVIYDFINQVHNGEISSQILDLSSQKIVMVFDFGGGTLDITIHKISRRDDAPDVLNVEDLAINRYTLLGGDDFDKTLSNAMFERYLAQYRNYPDIVQRIKREEASVKPQLLSYAEDLKIKVSMEKAGGFGVAVSDAWGDDEADTYPVGGNIGATGHAYDDSFTTEELENIWRKFMGAEYRFDDFKNLDDAVKKHGTVNIIFPILEVLKKCADKLGRDDFKIDAVIMNGGMSRFYMVKDRLKEFFGFEPIVALDPDLSVGRGAAVYHYFLHKYQEKISSFQNSALVPAKKTEQPKPEPKPAPYIRITKTILPDSLFLMTQGNKFEEILATGVELPHQSKLFTGFRLPKNAAKISIPIARRNLDGEFVVIAKGNITFRARAEEDTFVAFSVTMNEQRIIHMDAYTCSDVNGENRLDRGATEITIATDLDKAETRAPVRVDSAAAPAPVPVKIAPPLEVKPAVSRFFDYCQRASQAYRFSDSAAISRYSKLIREEKEKICAAGNPEDFAEPLLKLFSENSENEILKRDCEIIGRKIGAAWTPLQRRRLANLCMEQLQRDITFPSSFVSGGSNVTTKIQAIFTLSMCGSADDLDQLGKINNPKFKEARLYTHAVTKTNVNWIYEEFAQDCRKVKRGTKGSQIQNSAHAIGFAYRLDDPRPTLCSVKKGQIVSEICDILFAPALNDNEFINCIKALGLLCDRRFYNDIDKSAFDKARKILTEMRYGVGRFGKSKFIALKMMDGAALTADEEEFLLIKIGD